MGARRHDLRHPEFHDLLVRERAVAVQPLVLGCHLPRSVVETPRGVGEHRAELFARGVRKAQEVGGGGRDSSSSLPVGGAGRMGASSST